MDHGAPFDKLFLVSLFWHEFERNLGSRAAILVSVCLPGFLSEPAKTGRRLSPFHVTLKAV